MWHLFLGILLGHIGSQWISYHYVTFSIVNRMIIMKLDKLLEKSKCSRFKRKTHPENTSLHHLLSHLDLGHLLKLLQSLSQLKENTRHHHSHNSIKDQNHATHQSDRTISGQLKTGHFNSDELKTKQFDADEHKLSDHGLVESTHPLDISSKLASDCTDYKVDPNHNKLDSITKQESTPVMISASTSIDNGVSIEEEIVTDPSEPPSTLRFKKPLRRPTLTFV